MTVPSSPRLSMSLSFGKRKQSVVHQEEKVLWASRQVNLPSNDFETILWGEAGVPSASQEQNDDVIATPPASPVVSRQIESPPLANEHATTASSASLENEDDPPPPEIRLTNFCWKRRSGLGKFSVIHPWERRRLVLVGTKVLYFTLTEQEEEEFQIAEELREQQESSDDTASFTEASRPPWLEQAVATALQQQDEQDISTHNNSHDINAPRGLMDLYKAEGAVVEASEGNFACPTPYEVDLKIKGESWKLCFESQPIQIEWLAALTDVIQSNFSDNKEHQFEPGDHVIRWEMLPIVYPIQIHGIVLEAGRNCVIIADFGLTSYGRATSTDQFEDGESPKESHDFVMNAWKKLKPKQAKSKQRLNVIALTDPKEIRQWSKINYGRNVFSAAKGKKFASWFQNKSSSQSGALFEDGKAEKELEEAKQYISMCEEEQDTFTSENNLMGGSAKPSIVNTNGQVEEEEKVSEEGQLTDPDWFDRTGEQSEERPAVFELVGTDDDSQPSKAQKLPKSDPTKIVLARTNFLLEFGEQVLPPYHVFHSNSECIAVWCKTGRWSTLQTAVFLHSTAIGNAKSATVLTMGVAAAHVVLVPALAVGGLAMVTAPWLLLKKSKEKWEEATMKLTTLFWEWAEPEVYVEAIEQWSGLCHNTPTPNE